MPGRMSVLNGDNVTDAASLERMFAGVSAKVATLRHEATRK